MYRQIYVLLELFYKFDSKGSYSPTFSFDKSILVNTFFFILKIAYLSYLIENDSCFSCI